jgi:hypothetical protein
VIANSHITIGTTVVPQLVYCLVEVPEKAIVPFMVNAFDYVTFIHRLT